MQFGACKLLVKYLLYVYCKIILKRYNPFKLLYKQTDNDSNHSYNQELTDCIGLVAEASRVLEECKNYKISEINAFSEDENAATLFSTLFYNIGGNKSNFDNFAADIKALVWLKQTPNQIMVTCII